MFNDITVWLRVSNSFECTEEGNKRERTHLASVLFS